MPMIGERLEEARKSKGLTIREVAEATKIRGDFLMSMEGNNFDLGLPSIYVRGFLRNYSRYLKLDPHKILTDFDAHQLGKLSSTGVTPSATNRESLGHVDLRAPKAPESPHTPKPQPPSAQAVITEAPYEERPDPQVRFDINRPQDPQHAEPLSTERESRQSRHNDGDFFGENKDLYLKIGAALSGVVLVTILLVILFRLIGSSDAPVDPTPATAQVPTTHQTAPAGPSVATQSSDSITITASDNVTIIVEQTLDRQRLFSGTLNTGERISLNKRGPVSVRFTNGAAISIEANGETLRINQQGVGQTVVH